MNRSMAQQGPSFNKVIKTYSF